MLNLSNLKPGKNSKKKKKRVGRGQGSNLGKTCGRGHKGQNSRSGGGVRPGFEGGQTPLYRRLPKEHGFKNTLFKTTYRVINVSDLESYDGEVNPDVLVVAGDARAGDLIKILGDGEIKKALKVEAHKFSAGAKAKIEKAGGSASICQT
ncbi:MAG: 50S ribosomal protein L15 [Candidatus Margulisbacteria bacterium]|nr:50S ribosomal protein L15 [Candidatus Margulisiibacteriota bacterium]MBU1022089.1 50S ribosomal protein L15 [Candidatus Margulisiibacteriota bacterium]MBU1729684.1 50S ribosomal protein L15 [Candidatus Margulisiibacteriota bacterium]MBU1955004.1 50S ribosomal protein L15 [Candidatus Margulisiibacteriota bacterium]